MDIATCYTSPIPAQTKWAFTTRRVDRQDVAGINRHVENAVPGDMVFGKIIEIGQHKKIQLAEGRLSQSYLGDYVVAACGDRYAPDQFEGVAEIDPEGADLIAGGGLIGRMREFHARMAPPTRVLPIGLLTDRYGETINVANYGLAHGSVPRDMLVIGVVGASMNAGKTTAAASLAHGLSRAGYRVAVLKATGTGAFGDFNAYLDAGADVVADFTDAGMASTYLQPIERIERGFEALLAHAKYQGASIAIVELADGIFQRETAQILNGSVIRDTLSGVLYAAPDAVGAVGGVSILRKMGIDPLAVSGMVSCSPLAVQEAQPITQVPIVSREELRDPYIVTNLIRGLLAEFQTVQPIAMQHFRTAA